MSPSNRPNLDQCIHHLEASLQVVEELEDLLQEIHDTHSRNAESIRLPLETAAAA